MTLFWTAVFLLLCQIIERRECRTFPSTTPEDPADVINRTNDEYTRPVDFRCYRGPLYEFDDFKGDDYVIIGYAFEITMHESKIGCTYYADTQVLYPRLTGTDPMMPFYISKMNKGFFMTDEKHKLRKDTPLQRTKEYCSSWQLIAPAFLEYWERFHSDVDTCMKMIEYLKSCVIFRQIRELYAAKLYEKLCLDEAGCYNVMEYYDEDLPYCVKYTAISEFKNSSVGSWHNSVINYCRLAAMVPGTKEAKYDMSILREKGRTKEKLRDMCLYLRYRLLPEEGKEQAIPDTSDHEYETFEDEETTPVYENGGSNLVLSVYWNIVYVAIVRRFRLTSTVT